MMLCPKCHVEYREGFTECSDCKVDLITGYTKSNSLKKLSDKGISIIKYGICLLFFSFFQFIITLISYEFYFTYAANHGGVYGTVLSNVHPVIWAITVLEILIAIIVIVCGAIQREY